VDTTPRRVKPPGRFYLPAIFSNGRCPLFGGRRLPCCWLWVGRRAPVGGGFSRSLVRFDMRHVTNAWRRCPTTVVNPANAGIQEVRLFAIAAGEVHSNETRAPRPTGGPPSTGGDLGSRVRGNDYGVWLAAGLDRSGFLSDFVRAILYCDRIVPHNDHAVSMLDPCSHPRESGDPDDSTSGISMGGGCTGRMMVCLFSVRRARPVSSDLPVDRCIRGDCHVGVYTPPRNDSQDERRQSGPKNLFCISCHRERE
jgi:hypothetical protein